MEAIAAGKAGGVQFFLNAEVSEYTTGPRSFSEGFSVSLGHLNMTRSLSDDIYVLNLDKMTW